MKSKDISSIITGATIGACFVWLIKTEGGKEIISKIKNKILCLKDDFDNVLLEESSEFENLEVKNSTEIIMSDQPNKNHFFSNFKNLIVEFFKDRIELTRLAAIEKIAQILASLFAGIILVILFLFAIIFLSFLAGIYFSHLLQNSLYGFGIVAAFYVVLFLILIVFRKQLLEKFILNSLIHLFQERNETKENL